MLAVHNECEAVEIKSVRYGTIVSVSFAASLIFRSLELSSSDDDPQSASISQCDAYSHSMEFELGPGAGTPVYEFMLLFRLC